MKQKVLFCVPPSCGGAERVTLTIAKQLDREKFDIKIVIIGKTTGDIKQFIPDYMNIIHVKVRNIWDFTTLRLAKIFKQESPNVVFCSLMYLNVRVILAAYLHGGIKIIVRNNNSLSHLRMHEALMVRKTYGLADSIILQTEEMKDDIQSKIKHIDNKLKVISNPIDIELIKRSVTCSKNPFSDELINYVYVGRIHYVKGIDILIHSFASVVKYNSKVRLYIVGKYSCTDKYYQSLLNLISTLNLEEYIIWIGFTNNPYQFISKANCIVLSSRTEGLPNVILDAMWLQIPVVVTKSVPVIERIVTEKYGYTVDVNDIKNFSEAMIKAIKMDKPPRYIPQSNNEFIELFNS